MSHMPELEASVLPADAVEVGRIADAWGIKGWFKVAAFSADPEALFTAKQWYLQPPRRVRGSSPVRCCCRSSRRASTPIPSSPHRLS